MTSEAKHDAAGAVVRLLLTWARDYLAAALFVAASLLSPVATSLAQSNKTAGELIGLWKAENRFGPEARGTLIVERRSGGWVADFMGRRIPVREQGSVLTFELPNGQGAFRAKLRAGVLANGQWFQPFSPVLPHIATGIAFRLDGPRRWRGVVQPMDDTQTLYMMLQQRPDGSIGAFIRNPEQNTGWFKRADHILREDDRIEVIGHLGGQKAERVLMSGLYNRDDQVLSLAFAGHGLGGTYDFKREGDDSAFYPRGAHPLRYSYNAPPALGDGWRVGTLDEVGIDRKGIEDFVQRVLETPIDSTRAPALEGVLVARHGKLVLEEYFHGFSRDRLHDTRSAGKSLTSVMVGAAMHAGAPLKLSDHVFEVMNGGAFPPNIEPRKRAMTIQNLLTMNSGFFCDDRNPDAPGNEETMLDQEQEPDFYRFTMRAPMDRTPGEKAIYCSGDANLALGVLSRATGEYPMDLFDRLIGGPLQIARHGWYLSPSLQPYGGGSVKMLPRDFMKLGQLMLNRGVWNGKRILDEAYVRRASSPLYSLKNIQYGYLWWGIDWPYKNRTVHAFFAGGNGGQSVIVIPELDMVVATYAANYSDVTGLQIQQVYTPRYILPAVRERGDRPAPVVPRDYRLVYEIPPGQD